MIRLIFRWPIVAIAFFSTVSISLSYKILIVPISQKSHVSCMFEIAKELEQRGHKIHFLLDSTFNVDSKMTKETIERNITFISFNRAENTVFTASDEMFEKFAQNVVSNKASISKINKFSKQFMLAVAKDLLLENEQLMKTLKSVGFDISIIDGTFATKFLYLLTHRLGIPWITYTDYAEPWLIRVPWLPSFVPGQFSSVSDRMGFFDRIWNLIMTIFMTVMAPGLTLPDEILSKYQQYGKFDSMDEFSERSKFWLLTSDPFLDFVKPTMPHMAEIGGLTTKASTKLPEDIQSFLDGAEEGVIFMSFGSMFSNYPSILLRKFLDTFGRIERHRIIWRLENVSNEVQIPDYIKIGNWLPQNDILGHPKVKLFITHCGNNGQFEALYHGVPMIGLPFFGDQQYNAIRIQHKGYGIAMDLNEFTSEELYSNIIKILRDTSYKRRISVASEIFRSAPQRPAEKAAYWTEHVLRFGSDHLLSAARNLNFFQYYMLDVLAICLAVAIIPLVVVLKVCIWIVRKYVARRRMSKLKKA